MSVPKMIGESNFDELHLSTELHAGTGGCTDVLWSGETQAVKINLGTRRSVQPEGSISNIDGM